jgi:hypothetical protein
MKLKTLSVALMSALVVSAAAMADEGPNRKVRTTQAEITGGSLSLTEIRLRGLQMFSTPFNKADGFGEAPGATAAERRQNGNRGSLQGNGTFTRINGLDSQTCAECHGILSSTTVPFKFAVGGSGTMNNTVLGGGGASFVNINDDAGQINDPDGFGTTGAQNINGRTINPPIVFGSGGIELVGNEMTADLQALKAQADANPGTPVDLVTKGVSFGRLTANGDGTYDTSEVVGVNSDPSSSTFLCIQPFGRKGDNITTRTFDQGALAFHHGMQANEVLARNLGISVEEAAALDQDGDGVTNEVTVGELSAMNVYNAMLEKPRKLQARGKARRGERLFSEIGCAECHVPAMQTHTTHLGMRYPEIASNPDEHVYMRLNLAGRPTYFERNHQHGITVRMFADLKIHNMGPDLAEFNGDANFTTARLWGVADSAPYLHDGRALTLTDAILIHGGTGSDAKPAVDNFKGLSEGGQHAVVAFLKTLKSPKTVSTDLNRLAAHLDGHGHHGHR